MKKTRFSEAKIVSILKKQESGISTAEICREFGISAPKFNSGFLEVPVKISLVNHSGVGLAVDDLFITIYQFSESGWKNLGRSNPRPEGISLPAGRSTEITLTPRVAIISGILPNPVSLIHRSR